MEFGIFPAGDFPYFRPNMRAKKEWFESWFHSPYYELLYYKRDRDEAKGFIDALLNYLNPPAQARFLDLACGSGRHSIYLASKGYRVTGIDLSDELIEKAQASESDNLSFYVHDMRNEFRINYYDYVLNLFTSFGYFDTDHEHVRVLGNVFKGLKPGGTFVLDFFNADKVISTLVKNEIKDLGEVKFNISRTVENGSIIKTITAVSQGKEETFREQVRAYKPAELEDCFKKAGLTVTERFGSYDLKPFTPDSDRFIIVATKTHV